MRAEYDIGPGQGRFTAWFQFNQRRHDCGREQDTGGLDSPGHRGKEHPHAPQDDRPQQERTGAGWHPDNLTRNLADADRGARTQTGWYFVYA